MREQREKICNIRDASHSRALSRDASVTCGMCGAQANDPANVCDPVQLPTAGQLGD
jgi:hypothetical protein